MILTEDTACYAKEVIGFMPSVIEPGMENSSVLRSYMPVWLEKPIGKRCIVIGSFSDKMKQQLNEIFCNEWYMEYMEKANAESLVGAALCIIQANYGLVPLWALPKAACVIEFQQELNMIGEVQHLAHITELQSWVLLLSKGTKEQVEKQMIHEISRWFMKNEDSIVC
jgi:hypothetical protein